jgi:hypothetical protein
VSDERATGRDVILAIAENMRGSLEPLVTKTVAPSLYQVYLHAKDYERLNTIFGDIETEAKELLDRELAKLEKDGTPGPPMVDRLLGPLRRIKGKGAATAATSIAGNSEGESAGTNRDGRTGRPPREGARFVSAEGRWFIRFQEDPNGELQPGDIQVISEFAQQAAAGYGAGAPTHRISTTRRLGRAATPRELPNPAAAYARITYKDDSGAKEFCVVKDEVVIGRDAPDVWVDLRLETSLDVSREHARLRRVAETGAFLIKDLSKLGTTVNGRALPSSLESSGGSERDLDRWVDLPDRARIGLAGIVFLDFERSAGA